MKKIFLTRRNALLPSTNLSWGGYALVAVCAVALLRLAAPNFFWHLMSPVFGAADAVANESHRLLAHFGDTAALTLENERLASENTALTLENESIRKQVSDLGGLAHAKKGLTAGVVSRPPESPYDTLVVALGARGGVSVGMEVFGQGGVPLGVVNTVLADFSRVTLFTSPNTRSNGFVERGEKRVPLMLVGQGGGALGATAARATGIVEGDLVFAPGPGALPIGKVVRVDSDPSSPSVTLRIALLQSPFTLTTVELRDVGAELRDALFVATTTDMLP